MALFCCDTLQGSLHCNPCKLCVFWLPTSFLHFQFVLRYPFSAGDLRDSAQVLYNYLEGSSAVKIPWDDLRYIFGEIMYGGHIVGDWDRRMSQKYLLYFMRDELLDEIDMIPYAATWSNVFTCCILLQSVGSGRVFRSVQEQPSHAHVLSEEGKLSWPSPQPAAHERYLEHIETMPPESPFLGISFQDITGY